MLQRLIHINLNIKICCRHNELLFRIPVRNQSTHNRGFRLYSSHKVSALRNYYERTSIKGTGLFLRARLFSSQVDTQKSVRQIDSVHSKNAIKTTTKFDLKSKTSEIKRLFSLAAPEKWTLTGAIGFLIISSSVTIAVPFSLGKVLDIIYSSTNDLGASKEKLDALCFMLCGVFLLGGLCNFGRVYLMSISGQRMTQSLRKKAYAAILHQEPAWFHKTSTGELVNRLSADTQLVGRNLSQNVSDGLRSLLMTVAGAGMMFYMSPSLATIGLCVVPPVSMLAVIYGRFVRNITRQLQTTLADTSEGGGTSPGEQAVQVHQKLYERCYALPPTSLL